MNIIFTSGSDTLELSPRDGTLLALNHHGRNVIMPGRPLFLLRFQSGRKVTAQDFRAVTRENEVLFFQKEDLCVKIRIIPAGENAFRFRLLEAMLPAGEELYSYEIPGVSVPDDFTLLDPLSEGRLLPPGDREPDESAYQKEEQYGFYPGWCTSQLTAAFDQIGGVRLYARDTACGPKRFKMAGRHAGGFIIETFDWGKERYCGTFDLELSAFEGGWMEAARPYRDWVCASGILPEKTFDPEWLASSPVVVTYSVCGEGKVSGEPNEFIPYPNALPGLLKIAEATESRVLALPMRWDGRGPWTPPFQWPPVGGAASLKALADGLHAQGHLFGLYGSGASWTTYCYINRKTFDSGNTDIMTQTPDGKLAIRDFQPFRQSSHLCLQTEEAQTILMDEAIRIIANSGADFYQLFDQDMGGRVSECYAHDHHHTPGSGPHETAAGHRFHQKLVAALKERRLPAVIGTEGAAAEPFLNELRFNDLRIWFRYPVPLHEYLYHEFAADFSGNQCMHMHFDHAKSPENLFYRTALGFAYGNLLTFPMRRPGLADWGACAPWTLPEPPTDELLLLIKRLNALRKKYPKFLLHGRMLESFPFEGQVKKTIFNELGEDLKLDAVLATRWQAADGKTATFFTNWTRQEVVITVQGKQLTLPPLDAQVLEEK